MLTAASPASILAALMPDPPMLQNILQPALQQAARPGRPVTFKTIEATIYQCYAQASARLLDSKAKHTAHSANVREPRPLHPAQDPITDTVYVSDAPHQRNSGSKP